MGTYAYRTQGVYARTIHFDLKDGKLHNFSFEGGCNGNLKAIGRLVEGKDATEISALLAGNDCGGRGTSCADQLSRAVERAMQEQDA